MAARILSSRMPRPRSWSATIRARATSSGERAASSSCGPEPSTRQALAQLGEGLAAADGTALGDAAGLAVEPLGLAAADGDAPGLADGTTLGDAAAEALGTGDSGSDGTGVARVSVMNPLWPRSMPYSRIATNTPTTAMTKIADARSLMWTASSATVGATVFAVAVVFACVPARRPR